LVVTPLRYAEGGPRIVVGRTGDAQVEEREMSDRTYRVTEIVGTSTDSVQQAVRNGVARASQTLRHLDWFEVTQIRGHVVDGEVEHFQVTMKLGFRLEDA
jgi:flavin-binding protein dodecin